MHDHSFDRAVFLRFATVGLASGTAVAPVAAAAAYAAGPSMTPAEGLKKLMAGNAAFVAGQLSATTALAERRMEVTTSQHPFAMILSCADSRVPPEHIFDQGIGDLFICRVAGSIIETAALGSFEFAVATFKTPVIMIVLGHQRCGAVSASIGLTKTNKPAPTPSIQAIVDDIKPAIAATPQGSMKDAAYVDAVSKTSAKLVAKKVAAESEVLSGAVSAGTLKIVPAFYSLDSGKVTLLS